MASRSPASRRRTSCCPPSWARRAPILFGIALLCAGQSSTLTGTLAGQIVMEGYLHLRIAPWLRRLMTRLIALMPAVVVIALAGERSTQQLLILSQVILSLQLSFAVIPLIHFTSNRRNMGAFATPWWGQVLAWSAPGSSWRSTASWSSTSRSSGSRWRRVGDQARAGSPDWLVAAGLLRVTAAWPAFWSGSRSSRWFDPRRHWTPQASVQLDWVAGAPAALAGDDRRGPGARPGRRRDPQPRPEPGPSRRQSELVLLSRGRYADDPRSRRRDRRPRDRGRRALPRRAGPGPAQIGLSSRARSCSTAPTPPASSSATCGTIRSTCWSSARTATAWSATCSWADRRQGPPQPRRPDADRPPGREPSSTAATQARARPTHGP